MCVSLQILTEAKLMSPCPWFVSTRSKFTKARIPPEVRIEASCSPCFDFKFVFLSWRGVLGEKETHVYIHISVIVDYVGFRWFIVLNDLGAWH